MDVEALEARVKALETELNAMKQKVRALDDVEQIKELQRIYGYYLDNRMYAEAIDLFSDDTEEFEISTIGKFKGKEGVRKFLTSMKEGALKKPRNIRGLSLHMILQGVVHLDPDGKTASGRWQCFMCLNLNQDGKAQAVWSHGTFENRYIQEDGKWKFKNLHIYITFQSPFDEGWLKRPMMSTLDERSKRADIPATVDMTYPSDFVIPMHYKHPITGK